MSVNDWCSLHGLAVHDGWCALHRGGTTCDCDHFARAGLVRADCTCLKPSDVLLANMREPRDCNR